MRTCNAARLHIIGATAVAMLFLQLPAPAYATTGQVPGGSVRTLNSAQVATPDAPPAGAAAGSSAATEAEKPAVGAAAEAAAEPAKPKPLPPTLFARINLTTQTMVVQANGKTVHTWKVSTGAPGYATPPGNFKPGWMAKDWRSRQYDNAPMPYSVFFNGGIAVHGTMSPGSLGRAASHGCVRLATSNAATFFKLVSRHGMAQTRIIVHGAQPFRNNEMIASRAGRRNVRSSSDWVYSPPRASRRADSYGYDYVPQQRRITAARVPAPYWAR